MTRQGTGSWRPRLSPQTLQVLHFRAYLVSQPRPTCQGIKTKTSSQNRNRSPAGKPPLHIPSLNSIAHLQTPLTIHALGGSLSARELMVTGPAGLHPQADVCTHTLLITCWLFHHLPFFILTRAQKRHLLRMLNK